MTYRSLYAQRFTQRRSPCNQSCWCTTIYWLSVTGALLRGSFRTIKSYHLVGDAQGCVISSTWKVIYNVVRKIKSLSISFRINRWHCGLLLCIYQGTLLFSSQLVNYERDRACHYLVITQNKNMEVADQFDYKFEAKKPM